MLLSVHVHATYEADCCGKLKVCQNKYSHVCFGKSLPRFLCISLPCFFFWSMRVCNLAKMCVQSCAVAYSIEKTTYWVVRLECVVLYEIHRYISIPPSSNLASTSSNNDVIIIIITICLVGFLWFRKVKRCSRDHLSSFLKVY